MWANIALVFLFFLIGAVFAASEMALVSLRDSQIKNLAGKGKRGRSIVEVTSNPNRFLSAVQIGVTLSGFLSSSFGATTLATNYLAPFLTSCGVKPSVSGPLAVVLITIVISYFSIVISELTAKRLAMQNAESFSLVLGPFINGIAKMFRPLIWLLGISTNALVRLLGGNPEAAREEVTDEELRTMVGASTTLGDEERRIMDDVFEASNLTLREVMVPRTEVSFMAGGISAAQAIRDAKGGAHSRYPVTDGSSDTVVGFLHVRDLMDLDPVARQMMVRDLARPMLRLPETVNVLHALSAMRREHAHIALVVDEYGGTAGIVSLEDLVEELIGDITDEYDVIDPSIRRHAMDHDIDGLTTLEEFRERTSYELPEGPYDTVAGFLMARLGRVPEVGDSVVCLLPSVVVGDEEDASAYIKFEVVELDGRRASWIHAQKVEPEADPHLGEAGVTAHSCVPD